MIHGMTTFVYQQLLFYIIKKNIYQYQREDDNHVYLKHICIINLFIQGFAEVLCVVSDGETDFWFFKY